MKYFTFIIFNIILISGAKAQYYPLENYLEKKFQIVEVNTSIGIVDFRNILKKSITMKKVGKIFPLGIFFTRRKKIP